MTKGRMRIKFLLFFCLLIFTAAGFCLLSAHTAYAAGLEVDYPTFVSDINVVSKTELPEYLKYVFDLGIFIGFLTVFIGLAWAGVLYFLSPAKPDAVADAKDRAAGAISGAIILTLLYLIITTINPQLRIFKLQKLDPITADNTEKKPAGVYFYNSKDCSDDPKPNPEVSGIKDLGDKKNKINSVQIQSNPENDDYYVAVLYDVVDFRGKCQYINPKSKCDPVRPEPFAASATINKYDFFPSGDGVTFYRKSFFNKQGGYYKVENSKIKGIYVELLSNLKFQDPSNKDKDNPDGCTVPKDEQDCSMYDKNGQCVKRECPALAGENISSIKIDGAYLLLMVYLDPAKDDKKGPWSYCQAFPISGDVNQTGPKQIKWDSIMTTGKMPNAVVIIPIVK